MNHTKLECGCVLQDAEKGDGFAIDYCNTHSTHTEHRARAAIPEPPPRTGTVDIAPLVMTDIEARVEAGQEKYGTKLQAHNGRDALWDAYAEAIDLVFYLRQAIEERADA